MGPARLSFAMCRAGIGGGGALVVLTLGGGSIVAQQRGFGNAPTSTSRPASASAIRLIPLTATATAPFAAGIVKISVAPDGTPANNESFAPAISGDGRYIAYVSDASNLVAGASNGQRHIYVYDRRSGVNSVASLTGDGALANSLSNGPAISGDGRFVAFESEATNLAPFPPGRLASFHIFVRDRQAGTTVMADVTSAGTPANVDSFDPTISGDGRYVSFMSFATNLVPGDVNRCTGIYTRDLVTSTTVREDVTSSGAFGVCGSISIGSYRPSLSGDGRYVAFDSDDINLLPGGRDEPCSSGTAATGRCSSAHSARTAFRSTTAGRHP
jgi:Tol biopolymer transport system component